jgi:hypothetical protein
MTKRLLGFHPEISLWVCNSIFDISLKNKKEQKKWETVEIESKERIKMKYTRTWCRTSSISHSVGPLPTPPWFPAYDLLRAIVELGVIDLERGGRYSGAGSFVTASPMLSGFIGDPGYAELGWSQYVAVGDPGPRPACPVTPVKPVWRELRETVLALYPASLAIERGKKI